jgi:hypothetical protein
MEAIMARKQIKTVRLERQPHREALKRLGLAYQQLIAAAQASPPAAKQTPPTVQEVKPCP